MKKYRIPVLVLVCLLAAGAVYAASSDDSLISLRYLKETFFPQAVQAGEEAANKALEKTYQDAVAQLGGEGAEGVPSGSQSDALTRREWPDGQTITLPTGSGFLMLDGAAGLNHNGTVVDVTAGTEAASGSRLVPSHRYLVGENTYATVTVLSGQAAIGVQGSYTLQAGKPEHTPFYDVAQGDWYYAPVGYAYEKGLFSGVDAHHFAPGTPMNRAMLMTVLYSLAGSPADAGGPDFADVAPGSWYAKAIRWGAAQGIASGKGNNRFDPEGLITREQAAAILYSYAVNYLGRGAGTGADLSRYADAGKLSSWAGPAMAWAVEQGVISGVGGGGALTLEPGRGATRAEMSAMLRSFCEKIL